MTKLPVSTVYLLKRAELAVRGCVEQALARVGVTPSQYFVLLLVKCGEATSSAELARAMGVLPQSMTELVAPLERNRSIVRRPDPANNRILRIALTAAGERLFAKATEVALRLESELLSSLSRGDLGHLNRVLGELTSKAEAHSCHPRLRRVAKAPAAKPRRSTPSASRTAPAKTRPARRAAGAKVTRR